MNVASYPNKEYICCVCWKNLGNRRERLINPEKSKTVNKIKGKEYCNKCYEEELDDQVLHAKVTDEEMFLYRELNNCKCGAYKIAVDGIIVRVADCIC